MICFAQNADSEVLNFSKVGCKLINILESIIGQKIVKEDIIIHDLEADELDYIAFVCEVEHNFLMELLEEDIYSLRQMPTVGEVINFTENIIMNKIV